jgi:hypothetical protein
MSANPYFGFSWQDLGRIAEDLAKQLRQVVPTRERPDLDTRIEHLLREMAARMRPQPYRPHRPEQAFGRHGLHFIAEAYWRQAESELRNVRMREITEAAGYVLGGEAQMWLYRPVELPDFGRDTPRNAAALSEAGLRAALAELQRIALRRGATHEPAGDQDV